MHPAPPEAVSETVPETVPEMVPETVPETVKVRGPSRGYGPGRGHVNPGGVDPPRGIVCNHHGFHVIFPLKSRYGGRAHGTRELRRVAVALAMDPLPGRHHVDRTPLLLQLRADSLLRGDGRGRAKRGDPEAGAARPLVVPVGRDVHLPVGVAHHPPPHG